MGRQKRVLTVFVCDRCRWEWVPKDAAKPPERCPKCKSPYWDRPERMREDLPRAKRRRRRVGEPIGS